MQWELGRNVITLPLRDSFFMSRIEYDLLREDREDLHLPPWIQLETWDPTIIERLENYSREQLIALRTAKLLSREEPWSGL
jgi:hypothetical protein